MEDELDFDLDLLPVLARIQYDPEFIILGLDHQEVQAKQLKEQEQCV